MDKTKKCHAIPIWTRHKIKKKIAPCYRLDNTQNDLLLQIGEVKNEIPNRYDKKNDMLFEIEQDTK